MNDLEEWLTHKPAGPLFHYTSSSGLLGILESRTLWATSQRHLNDRKESGVAKLSLEREVSKARLFPAQERLLRQLILMAQDTSFVLSFSRKGDLLSQWRAYCVGGEGYSLGFDPAHELLKRHGQAKSFSLVRCIYSAMEQQKLSKILVEEFVSNYKRYADKSSTEPAFGENLRRFFDSYQLVFSMLMLTAAFKHKGFAEEREWRLVSQYPKDLVKELSYRAGRFGVVPYVKIPIWEKADDASPRERKIDKVIIGPNGNRRAALEAVKLLFETTGCVVPKLRVSSIPFRQR